MRTRNLLLAGTSALVLAAVAPRVALAFDITAPGAGQQTMTAGSTNTVSTAGTIVMGPGAAVITSGTGATLVNSGTVQSDVNAIHISHAGAAITNQGDIISTGGDGIYLNAASGTIANTVQGTITADNIGIQVQRPGADFSGDIVNDGIITAGSSGIFINAAISGDVVNTGQIDAAWGGIYVHNHAAGTIENTGSITGGDSGSGIYVHQSADRIQNSGEINAGWGIYANGDVARDIVNEASGTITALNHGITVAGAVAGSITNHGTIDAGQSGVAMRHGIYVMGTVAGDIVNTGIITTDGSGSSFAINVTDVAGDIINQGRLSSNSIALRARNVGNITNTGEIEGNVGIVVDTAGNIVNEGSIIAAVSGISTNGNVTGSITNSGTISAGLWAGIYIGGDVAGGIDNSGTIEGTIDPSGVGIYVEDGTADLVNTGTIKGASDYGAINYTDSNGGSTITQAGGLIDGDIYLSSRGDDTLNVTGGRILGNVIGDGGDSVNFDLSTGSFTLEGDIAAGMVRLQTGQVLVNQSRTVTGNFIADAGSTLAIGGIRADHGQLVIDGDADLTGSKLRVVITGPLTAGDVLENVVTVTDEKTFTKGMTILNSGALRFSDVGDDESIDLLVERLGYTPFANSPGRNVSAVLDQILESGSASTQMQVVLTALDNLDGAELATAIDQLQPVQPLGGVLATTAVVGQSVGAIGDRLAAMRDTQSGVATGNAFANSALWGQVTGSRTDRDTTDTTAGFRSTTGGLTMGGDAELSERVRVGAALTYGNAQIKGKDLRSGDRTQMNSYQLALYGTYDAQSYYLDGMVGAGLNKIEQKRRIGFLNSTAEADFDGIQSMARIGGGYNVGLGGDTTLTPMAALQYTRIYQDGYSETGAGGANTTMDSVTSDAIDSTLGARLRWQVEMAGTRVRPEVRAAWLHDFGDSQIEGRGTIGGVAFATIADRPSRDGLSLGIGADMLTAAGMTVRVDYGTEIRKDLVNHTGLLNLRTQF